MPVADLNEQLCFALYSASNRITSIYRPILKSFDLTYPQFAVLMALGKEDSVSITKLAKRLQIGKPTMTPLLKRLEQKQLIERQSLPDNDRQKNIALTTSGKTLANETQQITEQVFCATGLGAEEAKNLIDLCQKIRPPNQA